MMNIEIYIIFFEAYRTCNVIICMGSSLRVDGYVYLRSQGLEGHF